MKLIATWYRQGRGFALGVLVGALTLGKASPYLVNAFGSSNWRVNVGIASVLAVVAAVLVEHGAQVTAAATAGEALERLLDERHDVLISDIGMPVEDGYVLMERVRALPPSQGGRTPAVALTAYAHNSDRAKALLAGYTAHATKPIDPVELIQLIHSILGKRAGAASS